MATASAARFRRILCPIDFSPFSRSALLYAAAIADRHGSELAVAHANDPLLTTALAAAAYDTKKLASRTNGELRAFVRRVLGPQARPVHTIAGYGRPAEEIRRITRKAGIDLIVMGSRGLANVSKWFYGSTTEETLHTTRVPVLVVPKTRRRDLEPATLQAWPAGTVIVPIDLDDFTARDIKVALSVVRGLGGTPLLLHVVRASRIPKWLSLDAGPADRARVARAKQRLALLARSVGLKNECQVMFGDPADQIAMYAASAKAQLVVFTVVKPKSVFGPRKGSVTYRVVAGGSSPVLALPSARRR